MLHICIYNALLNLNTAYLIFFCYLTALQSAIISGSIMDTATICYFLYLKKAKMSFAKAVHVLLAYMPANQVLAKGIQIKVAMQDGWVDMREAQ